MIAGFYEKLDLKKFFAGVSNCVVFTFEKLKNIQHKEFFIFSFYFLLFILEREKKKHEQDG